MKNYPNYSCATRIKTEGRIILFDVPLAKGALEDLLLLRTKDGKELLLLDVRDAANLLEDFLRGVVEKEKDFLFVFPGNGANYPKSLSAICQSVAGIGVDAKRIWTPGTDPIAIAGSIMPEVFMNLYVKTIVVVDDVISSGQTMQKLYRNNEWRFPAAKWIATAWYSQVVSSGVKGCSHTFASFLVEGVCGRRVAINSLSTLREQPIMAGDYASRHFVDADEFLRLIK